MKKMTGRRWVAMACVLMSGMAAHAGEHFKFGVGLSYVDGFRLICERLEDRLSEEGYSTTLLNVPVGLNALLYYQFDHGSMLALDIGPVAMLTASVIGGPYDGDYTHVNVPIGLSYGYMFMPKARLSPFVRMGFKQHFGIGDFRDESSGGLIYGAGLSMFNNKKVHAQFEIAYDTAKGTYDAFGHDEEMTIYGLIVSLKAVF